MGGWEESEGDLSKIVAIGKNHCIVFLSPSRSACLA